MIETREIHPLSDIEPGKVVTIAGVRRSDQDFLQYLDTVGLIMNRDVKVVDRLVFDESIQLEVEGKSFIVSGNVSRNVMVMQTQEVADLRS